MTAPALDLHFSADTGLGDLISGELQGLSPIAVHETETAAALVWRAFFGTDGARDAARRALERRFAADDLIVTALDVPHEDWAARSQADLHHVRVGRVIVAPPWDVPSDLPSDAVRVIIKPSMGFGTGHHATTRLCLRLLQRIDCAGLRVLDVGTGSGVLAMTAASLGASEVTGIDVDPDALTSAGESLGLNDRVRPRVRFIRADLRDLQGTADVVLANLTGAALAASASKLLQSVRPGGRLVVSGFQRHEADAVVSAFSGSSACEALETEEDWGAALMRAEGRAASPRTQRPARADQQ